MQDQFQVDAYFERIGYRGRSEINLGTLSEIQARHTGAIAFENLDPLMGRTPALDEASLVSKLVSRRRGGYCYEHNGLLKLALEALGFRVHALAARVLWNAPEDAVTPRTHMLLLVELDKGQYVADVGFGVLTPTAPLRLESNSVQQTLHERYRLLPAGAEFVLQADVRGSWMSLYRFDLQEQVPSDYEVANWYVATHPRSLFVNSLVAARALPGKRHTLFDMELSTHYVATGRSERRVLGSLAELRDTLESVFELKLPDAPELGITLERVIVGRTAPRAVR